MSHLRKISFICALAVIALLTACRIDMHVQPRQNPLSRSDFFTDQRSEDRKSTRLNSSHQIISYAVFCLKKKKNTYDPSHHASNQNTAPHERSGPCLHVAYG